MRKPQFKKISLVIMGVIIVACATFIGLEFLTKTGFFKEPGIVIYDESLLDSEINLIGSVLTKDVVFDKDLKISAYNTLTKPDFGIYEYLTGVYVPVGDFYSSVTDVAIGSVEELMNNCLDCEYSLIDVNELNSNKKLLSINGHYYLDDFSSGAVFRVLKFESEKFDKNIMAKVQQILAKSYPNKENTLTFAQTGVTAMSRGMNTKMNEVNDAAFFAKNIGGFLSSFDLTHTSNEASFSNYATGYNICSDVRFFETLRLVGLDIVELTGNHNQDCGDEDAINSINMYKENGIYVVGGGKTADEASAPLLIDQKDNSITMLAYNLSTGGATYDDTPGANQYYEEVASVQISEAKKRGDFVIVDVQYYECSEYASEVEDTACDYADSAAGDQVGFFRHLIDLGADAVVGTSAHQPQTFELYGNGAIYYGLGNLFFDQAWWPGTTRSLILVHYFYNNRLLQTKIVPTIYDSDYQTRLLDEDTAKWFIERLISERPSF